VSVADAQAGAFDYFASADIGTLALREQPSTFIHRAFRVR
jgi:hypothetical protein